MTTNKKTIQIKTIINRLRLEQSIYVNYLSRTISQVDNSACHNYLTGFRSRDDLYYILIRNYAHLVLKFNERWAIKYDKQSFQSTKFKKEIHTFINNL